MSFARIESMSGNSSGTFRGVFLFPKERWHHEDDSRLFVLSCNFFACEDGEFFYWKTFRPMGIGKQVLLKGGS